MKLPRPQASARIWSDTAVARADHAVLEAPRNVAAGGGDRRDQRSTQAAHDGDERGDPDQGRDERGEPTLTGDDRSGG